MDIRRIFEVLGIEETKDGNLIKAAYRRKLVDVNPEYNPEGFKRLREAYEEALSYAAGQEEEEEPDNPVSLYIKRLDEVYRSLSTRLDSARWETLLAEELLDDLDMGEDAKWGVFSYLADHFRLPAYIWKLLDRTFHFTVYEQDFKERLPENFVNYMLWKASEEGDDGEFLYSRFSGQDTADYDEFITNYDVLIRLLKSESEYENREMWLKELEQKFAGMDALDISHPWYELEKARYAMELERQEEAERLVRALWAAGEKDDHTLLEGAEILNACGQEKDAEEVYRSFLEREDVGDNVVYTASIGMAAICFRRKELVEAREHALVAVRIYNTQVANEWCNTCNEGLIAFYNQEREKELTCEEGIRLAWCYIQTNRAMEGLEYFREHPILTEETADCHRVKAVLYMTSNQVEEAQKAVEEIQRWRQFLLKEEEQDEYLLAQSYEIEGKCLVTCYKAEEDGSQEAETIRKKALNAFNESISLQPDNINFLMSKMLFMRELKDYESMAELCEKMQSLDDGYYWAYFYAQEAYEGLYDAQKVVDTFYQAKEIYDGRPEIYERALEAFWAYRQYAEVQNILDQAEAAGVTSPKLKVKKLELMRMNAKDAKCLREADVYAEQLIKELEESQENNDQLAEAYMQRIYIHEEEAASRFRDLNKMKEWGKRAVALDDSDWNRYYLGRFYMRYLEDAKRSYKHLKICEERGMDFEWMYYFIARCHEAFKQWDDAIIYYKKAMEKAPDNASFPWRVAWLYRRKFIRTGQREYYQEALKYITIQIEKFKPEASDYWQLSDLHARSMDYEKALEEIEKELELEEVSRNWGHKGDLLVLLGRQEEAISCFEKGIEIDERKGTDYEYGYSQMYYYFSARRMYEDGVKWFEARMAGLKTKEQRRDNYIYLKEFYCRLGNWQKALEMVDRTFCVLSLKEYVWPTWEEEGKRINELLDLYQFCSTNEELAQKAQEAVALLEGEGGKKLEESNEGKRVAYMQVAYCYADYLMDDGTALKYFLKALEYAGAEGEKDSGYRTALDCIMRCLWRMGDMEQAKKYRELYMECLAEKYKECEALGKTTEELMLGTFSCRRIEIYYLFIASFFCGEYTKAKEYLKLMDESPLCWDCMRKNCQEEMECRGYMALAEGKVQEAIEYFERTLESAFTDNYDARRELKRLRS